MSIITNTPERLYAKGNNKCLDLNEYLSIAKRMKLHWEDTAIPASAGAFPLTLTSDAKACYQGKTQDMTELAFTQLCGAVGLPAAYIKKCFDTGRSGLALQNYFSWADRKTVPVGDEKVTL